MAGNEKQYDPVKAIKQVFQLAMLGATDKQMALCLGISLSTLEYWKRNHSEFMESLERGKLEADANVAHALYQRAIGYSHPAVHISVYKGEVYETPYTKHYPPDTDAAKHWLNIRQRENWTAVTKSENTFTNININKVDLTGLSTEDLIALEQIAKKQIKVQSKTAQKELGEHVGNN